MKLTEKEDRISWSQWDRTKYKNAAGKETIRMMKINKEESPANFILKLKSELEPFPKHLFDARWQTDKFTQLSTNVPDNTVVVCCDFAENFNCSYQDEAQRAHWSYEQVAIHPVMCYYRCPKVDCTQISEESILIISEDHNHDSHAVQHYITVAFDSLRSKGINIENYVMFSDGAPSQYKGKTSFADQAYAPPDFNCKMERHFFGSRHGKGPCDREIGTIKRSVVLAVRSRRAEVTDAKMFFNYCNDNLNRPKNDEHSHFLRTSKFVSNGDVSSNRLDRTSLMPVKDKRKYHSFRSLLDKDIESRERSCFCEICLTGVPTENCENLEFTGSWVKHSFSNRPRGQGRRQGRGQQGRGRGGLVGDDDGPPAMNGDLIGDTVTTDDGPPALNGDFVGDTVATEDDGPPAMNGDLVGDTWATDDDGPPAMNGDLVGDTGATDDDGPPAMNGDLVGNTWATDDDGPPAMNGDLVGNTWATDDDGPPAMNGDLVGGAVTTDDRANDSVTTDNDEHSETSMMEISGLSDFLDILLKESDDNEMTMSPIYPIADEVQSDPARDQRFQTRSFIAISHGNDIFPATVDNLLWVTFFTKGKRGLWMPGDISHTVTSADVVSTLQTPDIQMVGSRIYYKFDLAE